MMLQLSPLLVLVAIILRINAAILPGTYIIHSVVFPSQVLALPPGPQPPSTPVGWNQAQLPFQAKAWDVKPFQNGNSICNLATRKCLAYVAAKVVLDTNPYAWRFLQDVNGRTKIEVQTAGIAAVLAGPQNGAPIIPASDSADPRQLWVFQRS